MNTTINFREMLKKRNSLIKRLQKTTSSLLAASNKGQSNEVLKGLDERGFIYKELTETQKDISTAASTNLELHGADDSALNSEAVDILRLISDMESKIKVVLKEKLTNIETELSSIKKGQNTLKAYQSNHDSDFGLSVSKNG